MYSFWVVGWVKPSSPILPFVARVSLSCVRAADGYYGIQGTLRGIELLPYQAVLGGFIYWYIRLGIGGIKPLAIQGWLQGD